MSRLLPLLALVAWTGATLVLSSTRWARRPALVARLDPYRPRRAASGGDPARRHDRVWDLGRTLSAELGEAVARTTRVGDATERRLERLHLPASVAEIRSRQVLWAVLGLCAAGAAGLVLGLQGPVVPVLVVALPAVGFLGPEHRLDRAWQRRRQLLVAELPVVAEQLGMLLGTGHSLAGAIGRIAERGSGVAADELGHVRARIQHGLAEHQALAEWAERTDVVAVHRLVGVLALQRQAGDLGALIAEEARAMRLEAHRELLEVIERRAQQVWIPVTVAALVPGLLFLSVPFIEALRRFGAA